MLQLQTQKQVHVGLADSSRHQYVQESITYALLYVRKTQSSHASLQFTVHCTSTLGEAWQIAVNSENPQGEKQRVRAISPMSASHDCSVLVEESLSAVPDPSVLRSTHA